MVELKTETCSLALYLFFSLLYYLFSEDSQSKGSITLLIWSDAWNCTLSFHTVADKIPISQTMDM